MAINQNADLGALVTTAAKLTFNAAGTQTVHTTTVGQRLQVHYIFMKTPQVNANEIDVTVKLGVTTIYQTAMSPVDVFSHTLSSPAIGAASANLTVTIGDVSTVPVLYPVILYIDIDREEIT